MQEPNWQDIDGKYDKNPDRDDVVWVTKKTRGKFGTLDVAQPGDFGVVIGSWTSLTGSHKVCILTPDIRELATTASCVKVFSALADDEVWAGIKLEWMDKTYVPVIVVKKQNRMTMRRSQPQGSQWVVSRNGSAVLVSGLSKGKGDVWIGEDKVHPEDWTALLEGSEQCCSVRIPLWMAKKAGMFGV